ncbi:MAG: DUF6377 domain-containing protein [Bacteroidota bacterium]
MRYILFTFFTLISFNLYSADPVDSLLRVLDRELEVAASYIMIKNNKIENLKQELRNSFEDDEKYRLLDSIFELYQSYHYDSAFRYVSRLQDIAYEMNDQAKIAQSKIKMGFIFISSGMFKEAEDTLITVNQQSLKNDIRSEYYSVITLLYYGMADLQDIYYASLYQDKAHKYVDSVLMYSLPSSYDYQYFKGLRHVRKGEYERGLKVFQELLKRKNFDLHQKAIINSTMSDIYINLDEEEKAIELLAKASIFDVREATKETTAILYLANLIYRKGDIKRAYLYTKKALADANFYGARHRKIQVGNILPIIEEERINVIEKQRRTFLIYAIIVTLLSLLIIFFVFIILRQLKKLKLAEKEIIETNNALRHINQKLQESNKIKEEYIGYYFNIISNYIDRLENLKQNLEKNLEENKLDTVRYIVHSIKLKNERRNLYQGFDRIFLSLFPDFVNKFNKLFAEEDRIEVEDNELLNTDLRIFALIRLGINENDKIANILGFSVNTIYTYKTRIKNKSIVPNEEFERRIMEIRVM